MTVRRDPHTGGPTNGGRVPALDGIRGLAALVVVFHHISMTFPSVANAVLRSETTQVDTFSMSWLLTRTPAYILIDGVAAVTAFFILSGIVLTWPTLRRNEFRWPSYYAGRLARLYFPVFAAIGFCALLMQLVPRDIGPNPGAWMERAHVTYSISEMMRDAFLLAYPSGVISPLWTLSFEVAFSIALPLYLWLARRRPIPWILLFAAAIALVLASSLGSASRLYLLRFLPVFALGVVVAFRWDELCYSVRRLRVGQRALLLVSGILLTTLPTVLVGLGKASGFADRFYWVSSAGVLLLMAVALGSRNLRRWLESAPLRFLGRISFSLYLTHEPIVIAMQRFAHDNRSIVLLALPLSLIVALVFELLVERRLHRLAQRLARSVRGSRDATPLPPSQ